jgi:hypothetical protein
LPQLLRKLLFYGRGYSSVVGILPSICEALASIWKKRKLHFYEVIFYGMLYCIVLPNKRRKGKAGENF